VGSYFSDKVSKKLSAVYIFFYNLPEKTEPSSAISVACKFMTSLWIQRLLPLSCTCISWWELNRYSWEMVTLIPFCKDRNTDYDEL